MKNSIFLRVILVLLATSLCPSVWANSGKEKLWPDKIKVGGEFRTRVELRTNDDLNGSQDDNDTLVFLRTRVYLDLNPNDRLKLFGMFQNSETLGQGNSFFKTPDSNQFYQGFLQILTPGKVGTRVKLGRQELIYGEERLIGAFWWGNLGRHFDGLVLRLFNDAFWLDMFATRIKLPNGKEAQLYSTYGHWEKFPGGILEPYVIFYHGNNLGLNNGELSLVTVGGRIKAQFKQNWHYGFEGAYQTGASDGNLISAFALHSELNFIFPVHSKPNLGVEYNFASGDAAPGTGAVTLFNNILPTNHNKYGYIDYFSWRNMHDLSANFSIYPISLMKFHMAYHAFFLPEPANGVFAANGVQFRTGAPGASPWAGQEIDLLLTFSPFKYFNALVGYSVFFPGQFFADTGTSDVSQFFYGQFVAKY